MGTDALKSMGHEVTFGTNLSINLEPDTREETERLFNELGEGGKVTTNSETCSGARTSAA